jgi:hypothetical protein
MRTQVELALSPNSGRKARHELGAATLRSRRPPHQGLPTVATMVIDQTINVPKLTPISDSYVVACGLSLIWSVYRRLYVFLDNKFWREDYVGMEAI